MNPNIPPEEFSARAAEGLSSQALAREFGVSRATISRHSKREGVPIIGNKIPSIHTCRKAVERMPKGEAIEYLLDVIESFSTSQKSAVVATVTSFGFTPKEAQIILALFSGGVKSRDALYNALYASSPDGNGQPDPKIIDVFVCKVRVKLASSPWPVTIRTVWGHGYVGDRTEGFMFPWEVK